MEAEAPGAPEAHHWGGNYPSEQAACESGCQAQLY